MTDPANLDRFSQPTASEWDVEEEIRREEELSDWRFERDRDEEVNTETKS